MSGMNSYWMIGDAPSTPASPNEPTVSSSSRPHVQEDSAIVTTSTQQMPPKLVAIIPDCSISRVTGTPNRSSQHVADIQLVSKPTRQRHYSTATYGSASPTQGTSGTSSLVTSSTSISGLDEVPLVNYRPDIKLDDTALVTISTKELNRRLKKAGISQARCKQIKVERRTLKNRGYASSCRVSREEEEQRLTQTNQLLRNEISEHPPFQELKEYYKHLKSRVDRKEVEDLKNELQNAVDKLSPVEELDKDSIQLLKDLEVLKELNNMSDSDDSLSDPEKQGAKWKEEGDEFTSSEEETE